MGSLIVFVYFIVTHLLDLVVFVIIADVIASWLVQFQVINIRNHAARQIVDILDALCRPILWPFRRVIPTFGGLDITPLIALIVIRAAQAALHYGVYGF